MINATMAALTMVRITRNRPICCAAVAINLAIKISSICARINACKCFQRRVSCATASGEWPSATRTRTALTLRLLVCGALTPASNAGVPGAHCEAVFHVGHRFGMTLRNEPARHQVARLAGLTGLEAHHHGTHVGV